MTIKWRLFAVLFLVRALGAGVGQAGSASVRGPILGYLLDPGASRLRPILGLPGASRLGEPLDLGLTVTAAALSPRQDAIVAVAGGAPVVVALELPAGQPVRRHDIKGSSSNLRNFAFSPNGRAVALWAADAHHVQIVVGLPAAPALSADLDLSVIPGAFTAVAVSDGGAVLVAASDADRAAVYRVDSAASAGMVWAGSRIAALSFVPGQDDALLADSGTREIYLLRSVTGSPAPFRLAGAADGIADPVAVQSSRGRAWVANASGTVVAIDLALGSIQSLTCGCQPASLERLAGDAVFRLTAPDAATTWLLEDNAAGPRLLFVPPYSPAPRRATIPLPHSGRLR